MIVYTVVTIDKDHTIDLYHYNNYFNALECMSAYMDICKENNEIIVESVPCEYFRTNTNYECFIRKERMLDIE